MIRISSTFILVAFLQIFSYSQMPDASQLWITVDDHAGNVQTMYFGNALHATYCIDDGTNGTTNYFESMLPGGPPPSGFGVGWYGVRSAAGETCRPDPLSPRDYRSLPPNPEKVDTFRLVFGNLDIPDSVCTLNWPSAEELRTRCDSMYFLYLDPSTAETVRVNMFTLTRWQFPRATASGGYVSIRIYKFGCNIVDAIADSRDRDLPAYSLQQNYPNPFNPNTRISFSIGALSKVRLTIYDVLGREVATVADEVLAPGQYTREWNASGLPSGVYFYKLQSGNFKKINRLLVLR